MKFKSAQKLSDIALIIGAEFVGPEDFPVLGLNEIHSVNKGELVFIDNPKYLKRALASKATVILYKEKISVPDGKALLIVNDPFKAMMRLIEHLGTFERVPKEQRNQISETANIDESTIIQPGVFIGNHVKIGKNCIIHPNVTIYDHTEIGENVIIHANTVIGKDAFYYQKRDSGFLQFTSCGRTIIEDYVHIGANCTVDRGVTSDTVIGKGSKLDSFIHVGHDSIIGENCIIASQVGIAGFVTIKDNTKIWAQAGVGVGLTINENTTVLAKSAVTKDLEAGKTYFGIPCEEKIVKLRELNSLKNLAKKEVC